MSGSSDSFPQLIADQFGGKLNIDTVSGGSKIRLPEKSEFNIKFISTSGDLVSDFPFSVNGAKGNKHNFEGSVGSSTNSITGNSVSGGMRITK